MALTDYQNDAIAYLRSLLESYGLGGLAQWAYDQVVEGNSPVMVQQLLRDRPEFRQRFPAIFTRQQKNLPPISVEEYVAYERQAAQLMRQAGLPQGLYDSPDDFTDFINKDVSFSELTQRVNEGFLRVAQAPRQVREAFGSMFGPQGDSALAAVFLDPDKALPLLEQQVAAAEFGGFGKQAGFNFSKSEALTAADYARNQQQIQAGIGQIAELRPLFTETIDEDTDIRAEREGVASVLGNELNASEDIRRRQEERRAAGAGGGGSYITNQGSGLGKAR